jgi:multiple sugar transport system substrate-binding protein
LKQSIPILIAAFLVVVFLSVFFLERLGGYPDSSDGVVRVYYADNISPAHQWVVDEFNRSHRGRIEVVPVNLPFAKFSTNERKELLARSLRNKSDRLDIFAVDLIWVPRFSRWCETLDGLVSGEERNQILPQAEESCVFDGHLMALPVYLDVGLLYYRRDLIRALPHGASLEQTLRSSMTWGQFDSLGRAAASSGRPFYLFQGNDFEGLTCCYFEMIAGQDRDFFHRRPLDFESPVAKHALRMLVDFVWKDRISPPAVTEFDEIRSYTYALNQDAYTVRGWPNFLESFHAGTIVKPAVDSMDRAPLPHFPGHAPVSIFGGWNLMISRYSTRSKEALEFAKFIQREEVQEKLFEIGGYIPTNLAVYADSAYIHAHPVLAFYRDLIPFGFHRPALVQYTKMSDIISRAVHRAVKGEVDPDSALREASREIAKAGATE